MAELKLILASGSKVRATILNNANVPFTVQKTNTDEDTIKKEGLASNHDLEKIALDLAIAKARAVKTQPENLVLGADQLMEFENKPYDKPKTLEEAKERLYQFRAKPHSLINASVLLQNDKLIWHHIERPVLHMRNYTRDELDLYFANCNEDILNSVGAYQLEHIGIRLFERIEGDYFAILGLALSPLLAVLRQHKIIEF